MIKGNRFPLTASLVLLGIWATAGSPVLPVAGATTAARVSVGKTKAAGGVHWNDASPGSDAKGASSSDANRNAAGQAFTLVSLKHETVGSLTRIMVESSAPPLYTVSRPSDRLIVIELPGGDGSKLAREYSLDTTTVDSIRVRGGGRVALGADRNASGQALTSIEIAVKSGIKDRSTLSGNILVLELSPERPAGLDNERPAASAKGLQPEHSQGSADRSALHRSEAADARLAAGLADDGAAAGAKQRPENAGVYVYPVSVKASTPNPRLNDQTTLKPATALRAVRTEPGGAGIRILLDADGQVEFKDFTLTNPERIVIDVIGVKSDFGNKTMEIDSAGIERLRVGQPSARVVRIVLDSKQKVAYRVVREGASLVIEVGNDGSRTVIPQAAADSYPQSGEPASQQTQPKLPKAVAPPTAESTPNKEAAGTPGSQSKNVKAAATTDTKAQTPPPSKVQTTTAPPAVQPKQGKDTVGTSDSQSKSAKTAAGADAKDAKSDHPSQLQTSQAAQSSSTAVTQPTATAVTPVSAKVSSPAGTSSRNQTGTPSPSSASFAAPAPGKDLIAKADSPRRAIVDATSSVQTPVSDTSGRGRSVAPPRRRADAAMCDVDYVGGPISFDLRAVDIREMLRFIYQNYGVNFIVDKSVAQVPVDITITGVPWNQVMNAVLRANRLGWVCEDQGRIVRIATLTAIKEEESERQAIAEEKNKGVPLKTVIRHLRYARASGSLAGTGSGSSSGAGGGSTGGASAGGGGAARGGTQGSLLSIITSRNSSRGKTEVDSRTNSLIITDLPERIDAIMAILDLLDKPEAQVEIEGRIVVADRNFLRDLGVQLAAAVTNGKTGGTVVLETGPVVAGGGGLSSNSNGSSSGSSSGTSGSTTNQIASNIPFTPAQSALQATANTVLGLTSGRIGTGILSAALSASESKGQIRTISTPRITAQDNMTAEIVNGVQIPVQTVTNNTVTTTFVTAALRLEITPQIVEETGEVTMHVVAENNTVNSSLANQFNGGTPGINTQSAESIMRVKDGGTAVMGGINIDNESTTVNSTPGLASIPILGNLFKRKTVSRDNSEILFFISPRIVHRELPESAPGSAGAQSSLVPNAAADGKVTDASPKQASAVAASTAGLPSTSK
jgi:type IV pilus secretin PilQ/predicted competence protein